MTDDALKAMFDALHRDNATMREENARNNAALREETAAIRADNVSMREENAKAHAETRRHFDIALEAARRETRLVAESVDQTREMLDRKSAELERTANETQAMIKFSHAELYNRMRTLEETHSKLEGALADLEARVERLEGSTH